jgi:hypothetical protein
VRLRGNSRTAINPLMNDIFISLVESNSYIELAHLQVEGKTEGHGRIEVKDRSIVLSAITKAAEIRPGEDLKLKATARDSAIFRITGSVLSVETSQRGTFAQYLRLTVQIDEVRGRESGKDPDEDLADAPEKITSNIAIPKLFASNATTTISVGISVLNVGSTDIKSDCLVIDDNSYVLQRRDLRVTWKPQPNRNIDSGIPLLAAVAYLHGAPTWYYYQSVRTKEDEFHQLRNNLKLPVTRLTPLTERLAKPHPEHAISVIKAITRLLSEHQFREQIHDMLHNFIVGTADSVDGVAATLLSAAALEGLCRVVQGQGEKGKANQMIRDTGKDLQLPDYVIEQGLKCWERVRDTLAHGHFYRAHNRDMNAHIPRSPDENIIHDLSRISGLFHAILLKTAGYAGPVAISKFEDRQAEI